MEQRIKNAKRLILMDLLYLGDLIFATPLYKNLRRLYPNARIDLVMNEDFYPILKGSPHFDHIYPYTKKSSLRQSIEFARRLKDNHYDLGLNIHGSWRSVLLLKIIDPDYIVGFGAGLKSLFMHQAVEPLPNKHMVEVYLDFLKAVGFRNLLICPPELHIPAQAEEKAEEFCKKNRIADANIVGLNTGGSWQTKQWSAKQFAQLADELQLRHEKLRVLFLGGPSDIPKVKAIVSQMTTIPVIATGQTTLPELAALVKKCILVISGDSGPVHVSAAVGVPTITLFGPSDERKYRPYGEKHLIITEDLVCRPCGKHQCPHRHHRCMEGIAVETVVKHAETVLQERNASKN